MKEGDKLYCYNDNCFDPLGQNRYYTMNSFTKGKYYEIKYILDLNGIEWIKLTDDNGKIAHFNNYNNKNQFNQLKYTHWFYTTKDIRKLKLNKLKYLITS